MKFKGCLVVLLVTLLGNTTLVKLGLSQNAPDPILATPVPKVTLVRLGS